MEDNDRALLAAALGDVARARGMAQIAEAAGPTRRPAITAASPRQPTSHSRLDRYAPMEYSLAVLTFIELPTFSKYREDYLDDEQFAELQAYLMREPQAGDVVPETGGVRKLRWARAGMGKRGGMRVLYYLQDAKGRVWLLTLYAKSAKENISAKTLTLLREMADEAEIE